MTRVTNSDTNEEIEPDYPNYANLIELVGSLVRNTTSRPLRILMDCGATNNFLNRKTADELGIPYDDTLAEVVETGDSTHRVQSYGETKTMKMKITSIFALGNSSR